MLLQMLTWIKLDTSSNLFCRSLLELTVSRSQRDRSAATVLRMNCQVRLFSTIRDRVDYTSKVVRHGDDE